MMDEASATAIAMVGEFITLGLIEEVTDGWRLTIKGRVEADKVLNKLSNREQALVMLRASLILKEPSS